MSEIGQAKEAVAAVVAKDLSWVAAHPTYWFLIGAGAGAAAISVVRYVLGF
jgi:hypothetical protein